MFAPLLITVFLKVNVQSTLPAVIKDTPARRLCDPKKLVSSNKGPCSSMDDPLVACSGHQWIVFLVSPRRGVREFVPAHRLCQ